MELKTRDRIYSSSVHLMRRYMAARSLTARIGIPTPVKERRGSFISKDNREQNIGFGGVSPFNELIRYKMESFFFYLR
jgi:hypothetical protein